MENKTYSIGEISKLLNVQSHTIRFWEKEFPFLSPNRSQSGRRTYTLDDLKMLQYIRDLLYNKGYTTKGALKKIEEEIAQKGSLIIQKNPIDNKLEKKNEVSQANKDAANISLTEPLKTIIDKKIVMKIYNEIETLIEMWENIER
ncbi:MAG TPA: MerR family transcriptional regulator [Spirochaetota bacterium]|nr:MerR family transcriptional regulator [Spirochaetota bacterium]HOM37954.1 MerR family transcriptional regulator [Spirochaetota bacterium]HPQ48759.1 MerR family transcriptional regulator [Spirochaetota bacterium]